MQKKAMKIRKLKTVRSDEHYNLFDEKEKWLWYASESFKKSGMAKEEADKKSSSLGFR